MRASMVGAVSDILDTRATWLTDDELSTARERLPIVYVDAVPVRVDSLGQVTLVGLLLRAMPNGELSRAIVSGRVLYGERIRDAVLRHIEKDLGSLALPQIPASPQPFAVVEYFPSSEVTGFHDPRHHAVSLAFVVPVSGDCQPSQQALDLGWFTPDQSVSEQMRNEMTSGHDRLIRLALASVGQLP